MVNWSIKTYNTLSSTQDTLKELIEAGSAEEGGVIHAHEQTGGYGRYGRKWEGSAGNLSFSFMLKPRVHAVQNTSLSLVVGIALTRAIQSMLESISHDNIRLKWPNDVMINGLKCAGILMEQVEDALVIGIGVNISSSPLENSTCLLDHTDEAEITARKLLEKFLEIFDGIYPVWQKQGFALIKPEFMRLTYSKDTPISVKLPKGQIEGTFQGIDEHGNMLILCTDSQKPQKITAGEVFLV